MSDAASELPLALPPPLPSPLKAAEQSPRESSVSSSSPRKVPSREFYVAVPVLTPSERSRYHPSSPSATSTPAPERGSSENPRRTPLRTRRAPTTFPQTVVPIPPKRDGVTRTLSTAQETSPTMPNDVTTLPTPENPPASTERRRPGRPRKDEQRKQETPAIKRPPGRPRKDGLPPGAPRKESLSAVVAVPSTSAAPSQPEQGVTASLQPPATLPATPHYPGYHWPPPGPSDPNPAADPAAPPPPNQPYYYYWPQNGTTPYPHPYPPPGGPTPSSSSSPATGNPLHPLYYPQGPAYSYSYGSRPLPTAPQAVQLASTLAPPTAYTNTAPRVDPAAKSTLVSPPIQAPNPSPNIPSRSVQAPPIPVGSGSKPTSNQVPSSTLTAHPPSEPQAQAGAITGPSITRPSDVDGMDIDPPPSTTPDPPTVQSTRAVTTGRSHAAPLPEGEAWLMEAYQAQLSQLSKRYGNGMPVLYADHGTFWVPQKSNFFLLMGLENVHVGGAGGSSSGATGAQSSVIPSTSYSTKIEIHNPSFFYWDPLALVVGGIPCPMTGCTNFLQRVGHCTHPKKCITQSLINPPPPSASTNPVSSTQVTSSSYATNTPSCFWIIAARYRCTPCTAPELTAAGKKSISFASWDERVLKMLPPVLRAEFPAKMVKGWQTGTGSGRGAAGPTSSMVGMSMRDDRWKGPLVESAGNQNVGDSGNSVARGGVEVDEPDFDRDIDEVEFAALDNIPERFRVDPPAESSMEPPSSSLVPITSVTAGARRAASTAFNPPVSTSGTTTTASTVAGAAVGPVRQRKSRSKAAVAARRASAVAITAAGDSGATGNVASAAPLQSTFTPLPQPSVPVVPASIPPSVSSSALAHSAPVNPVPAPVPIVTPLANAGSTHEEDDEDDSSARAAIEALTSALTPQSATGSADPSQTVVNANVQSRGNRGTTPAVISTNDGARERTKSAEKATEGDDNREPAVSPDDAAIIAAVAAGALAGATAGFGTVHPLVLRAGSTIASSATDGTPASSAAQSQPTAASSQSIGSGEANTGRSRPPVSTAAVLLPPTPQTAPRLTKATERTRTPRGTYSRPSAAASAQKQGGYNPYVPIAPATSTASTSSATPNTAAASAPSATPSAPTTVTGADGAAQTLLWHPQLGFIHPFAVQNGFHLPPTSTAAPSVADKTASPASTGQDGASGSAANPNPPSVAPPTTVPPSSSANINPRLNPVGQPSSTPSDKAPGQQDIGEVPPVPKLTKRRLPSEFGQGGVATNRKKPSPPAPSTTAPTIQPTAPAVTAATTAPSAAATSSTAPSTSSTATPGAQSRYLKPTHTTPAAPDSTTGVASGSGPVAFPFHVPPAPQPYRIRERRKVAASTPAAESTAAPPAPVPAPAQTNDAGATVPSASVNPPPA